MQKDDTPTHYYDLSSCSVIVRALFTEQGYWSSSLSQRLNSWRTLLTEAFLTMSEWLEQHCQENQSWILRTLVSNMEAQSWPGSVAFGRGWIRLLVVGGCYRWFQFGMSPCEIQLNSICPLIIRPLLAPHSHTRLASGPTLSDEVGRQGQRQA